MHVWGEHGAMHRAGRRAEGPGGHGLGRANARDHGVGQGAVGACGVGRAEVRRAHVLHHLVLHEQR